MEEPQKPNEVERKSTDLNDVFEKNESPVPNKSATPVQKKSEKTLKTVVAVLGGVLIAVTSFFAGILVHRGAIDDEMLTLMKLKAAIQRYYYKDISDDEFYDVLFDAVNEGLLDDYSEYLPAEELEREIREAEGGYVGFGLTFYKTETESEKGKYIVRVSGNSPAERAGIRSRSYLTGYGLTQESVQPYTTYAEFSAFCDGIQVGQQVYLEVRDSESSPKRLVQLARGEYAENYVYYRSSTTAYSFTGDKADTLTSLSAAYYLPIAADTAYIELTAFNGNAAGQFDKAMQTFKAEGKKNLVLDLRSNGGGYMDILCSIGSYFCKNDLAKNPIIATANYRNGSTEKFRADRNAYFEYFTQDSRICVLADQNTASASECLIGAMIDHGACSYADMCLTEKGGVAKTFGKGIMQSTYGLTLVGKKDAVTLTSATIHWPVSKNCIHDRGVLASDGTKTATYSTEGDQELLAALSALGINA